ncbi:MAG: oxygenase MpaB family protein [Acidimicrobiales bacterium]
MADHFPKGSVIRKVNNEPAIMFGAGRALLLQLAHPAVAQGVQDHSEFKKNPFKRLQGTLEATYAVVFGSADLARGVGRRIQWIHEYVVGPGYTANDPANLLWVHATLCDTALRCYEELVEELSPDEAETYYQEMKRVAVAFGVGLEHQPESLADFRDYMAAAVAGIEMTDVGKDLAGFILDPALPLGLHIPFKPLLRVQRLFTLGSLPPAVRDQLDVDWSDREQARYDRAQRAVHRMFRVVPRPIRTSGNRVGGPILLWMAARHVRQFEDKQRARTDAHHHAAA